MWRAPLDHFDGTAWTRHPVPSDIDFNMVHGSASDNVWFVGDQHILRWDGSAFHEVPLPEVSGKFPHFVSAVHTLAPDDAWIVRWSSNVLSLLHFDGVEWTDTPLARKNP